MSKVFLGIGTNMGDRESNFRSAIKGIEENIGRVVKLSSSYQTEPWGFESGNKFLNAVAEVETKKTPSGVLGAILKIEVQLGRLREEKQYASRTIDIDILLFDDLIIDEVHLKIPHPLIHERKFVLVPLSEIAPEKVHPVLNKTVISLLETCKDSCGVKKVL